MIQHHSGCIYFSIETLDPWHFLHTTNLPESVFTRELTGSLDDLTSEGQTKMVPPKTKEKQVPGSEFTAI